MYQNLYVESIEKQRLEVLHKLSLPQLQPHELRTLAGRQRGLVKQLLSSVTLQRYAEERARRLNPKLVVPQPIRVVPRNKRGRVWADHFD